MAIAPSPARMHPGVDPAFAAAFDDELRALCTLRLRAVCWLVLALTPVFACLDALLYPDQQRTFLALRATMAIASAAGIVTSRTAWGSTRGLEIAAATKLFVGLAIVAMVALTDLERSPYYAGLMLVILGAGTVMPWPPVWTFGLSIVLVISYLFTVTSPGPVRSPALLLNNLAFLGSTVLLTSVGSALQHGLRLRAVESRHRLEAALRHREDFFASMSHEMRTPLNVMQGYAEMLADEVRDVASPQARDYLTRLQDSGRALHDLISGLLDSARIDAGRLELRPESVLIAEFVAHLNDLFAPIAARLGIRFDARGPADDSAVSIDRLRLQQILVNLIGNALKFAPNGSITLEAAWTSSPAEPLRSFHFLDHGGPAPKRPTLLFFVRDTGVGIAPGELDRLAEDFRQVGDAATGKYGGTGLGLSISRKLAALMGGRIAVQSRPGEGTTFVVALPATPLRIRHAA